MYRSKHNDLFATWVANTMGVISGSLHVWYNPSYGWGNGEDYVVILQQRFCLLPREANTQSN